MTKYKIIDIIGSEFKEINSIIAYINKNFFLKPNQFDVTTYKEIKSDRKNTFNDPHKLIERCKSPLYKAIIIEESVIESQLLKEFRTLIWYFYVVVI